MVAAVAGLVREVALAAGRPDTWVFSTWWRRLVDDPTWALTGGIALAGIVIAFALLYLALVRSTGSERPTLVMLETAQGATSLDVTAIERALRKLLKAELTGIVVRSLAISQGREGCRVRVEADVPATDLVGMQERAYEVLAPDLERTSGLSLEAVDIVVTRLLPKAAVKNAQASPASQRRLSLSSLRRR